MFKKKEISQDEKIYQYHQNWIFFLTGAWLIATFEHNYYTLSSYSLNKIWSVFGYKIPISDVGTFLLVLALELTLFWSISFIPSGKRWGINMKFIYVIQFVSTSISVLLNIKYMVEASPTPSFMDIGIGAIVGGLIPVFVILFGYIEGHVYDTRVDAGVFKTSQKVTKESIKEAISQNPNLTQRQLAKMFDVSAATINAKIREIQGERIGGNGR
jgi:hypothetical protein